MQWNGTDWVLVEDTALTVTEADGIVGNEVTGATDGTLLLSGNGTDAVPYTLGVNDLGIGTDQLADGAVTNIKIADDNVTLDKIANGTVAGQLMQWNGTDWELINNLTITGTLEVTGQTTINEGPQSTTLPIDRGSAGQVLTTDGLGTASWATPITYQNLFDADDILQEDRTHDLNGNNFVLGGSGTIGIGIFGGTEPALSTDKLDVNGQIRVHQGIASNEGTVTEPAYSFFTDGDTNTGMFRADEDQIGFSTNGQEAIRIDDSQNVGVGTIAPNSTLHTGGSFSTAILITNSDLTLDNSHHTIILGDNHNITLPSANLFTGRIYIIKNTTAFTPTISTYLDSDGAITNTIALGVIQLQSDGTNWQQIN